MRLLAIAVVIASCTDLAPAPPSDESETLPRRAKPPTRPLHEPEFVQPRTPVSFSHIHDEPEPLPAYTPDWSESFGRETLLEGARRNLPEIAVSSAREADLLVFRLRAAGPAKHIALLTTLHTMIHAVENAPVCEVHLGRWWRRHAVAAFAFPEVR